MKITKLFKPLTFVCFIALTLSNCKEKETDDSPSPTITKPTVTTNDVTAIKQQSVTCGGNVTADGGDAITDRGVCWSLAPEPTVEDSKQSGGTGKGAFSVDVKGLALGTKYYMRAYAINSKGTSYGEEKSFTTDATLEIGLEYQGGLIFFLDPTKQHGLVCPDTNLGVFDKWGCKGKQITGAMGKTLGTGAQNTLDIVAGCNTGSAAQICANFTLKGYSDWFLPSEDELVLIYTNLKSKGFGHFSNDAYWSSTQASSDGDDYARYVSFFDGTTGNGGKDNPSSIRAARAF